MSPYENLETFGSLEGVSEMQKKILLDQVCVNLSLKVTLSLVFPLAEKNATIKY